MTDDAWITEDETGGQKQAKKRSWATMPWAQLRGLSKHYAKGEEKYPKDAETNQPNYMKGYPASLSFEALMDHAALYWEGETIDPETGSNHMLAVAWHALNLVRLTGSEFDDRWL